MPEVWIGYASVHPWQDPVRWTGFFEEAQRLLGSPMTHLDTNDPVRRKVTSLEDAGHYACAFGPKEEDRCMFGRFLKARIDFSAWHWNAQQAGDRANNLTWYLPQSFLKRPENLPRIRALFDLGNRFFSPFYSFADDLVYIESKKKESGAVSLQSELLGVYWLTYFNAPYVKFFGEDKFAALPRVERSPRGDATVILGERWDKVPAEVREQAAETLGRKSFVDTRDFTYKPPGRHSLTYKQLLEEPPEI